MCFSSCSRIVSKWSCNTNSNSFYWSNGTILGSFFVKSKEDVSQKALLSALRRGTYFSAIVIAIASYFVVSNVLGKGHIGIYISILCGLVAGLLIGFFTEYYTSDNYNPTKSIAKSSELVLLQLLLLVYQWE